jgi:hypothetical protein
MMGNHMLNRLAGWREKTTGGLGGGPTDSLAEPALLLKTPAAAGLRWPCWPAGGLFTYETISPSWANFVQDRLQCLHMCQAALDDPS